MERLIHQPRPMAITIHDELPPEDEPVVIVRDYQPCAEFLAYVKETKILSSGELVIALGIPFEYKYDALAITDERGVMFKVICEKPIRRQHIDDMDDDD